VFVVAVVCAVTVPVPATTAVASTCGATVGGCVETKIVPLGGSGTESSVVRVLQVNLCNSGIAHCYRQDRSPGEAAGLVDRYRPTVVTLNEICAADVLGAVAALPAAMRQVAREQGDATVFALFASAVNRYTGRPYRCADGDLYGIGIVGRGPAPATPTHYLYRSQNPLSDEERVAVCTRIGYTVCATHLESDATPVAAAECHELMRHVGAVHPIVVAGDFNLATDVAACVPPGWGHTGDGAVQHVLTAGLRITGTRTVHMGYTDHPALLVDLAAA
jgi:hypothetical protein